MAGVDSLYVRNLSYGTKDDTLKGAFEDSVSAQIIMDRETGQSKGYGFVKFLSPEAAESALQRCGGPNGTWNIDGRDCKVNYAQARQGGFSSRGGGGGSRGRGGSYNQGGGEYSQGGYGGRGGYRGGQQQYGYGGQGGYGGGGGQGYADYSQQGGGYGQQGGGGYGGQQSWGGSAY